MDDDQKAQGSAEDCDCGYHRLHHALEKLKAQAVNLVRTSRLDSSMESLGLAPIIDRDTAAAVAVIYAEAIERIDTIMSERVSKACPVPTKIEMKLAESLTDSNIDDAVDVIALMAKILGAPAPNPNPNPNPKPEATSSDVLEAAGISPE